MIPTYKEAENIGPLLSRILSLPLDLEVVVVDDDSPDDTAAVVRKIAGEDSRVHLLSRPGPRGRGLAGREGFLWALARRPDYILEMDGDGSHDPGEIALLAGEIGEADVVIGSRFLSGGKVVGRGWLRRGISSWARAYLRLLIGTKVSDPTSGYRLFRRTALEAIRPATLTAADPFIVTEVLFRCHRLGLRIREVPVVFREREKGESKLRTSILLKYFLRVIKLRFSGGKF